jgi:addiction module HigA family antidote
MAMYNPPHPGEFIRAIYLQPFALSARKVAESLKVSPSTFNRLLNGESNVSPEMALRLSRALGRSPESWMAMQDQYDLWHAQQRVDLREVKKVVLSAAGGG